MGICFVVYRYSLIDPEWVRYEPVFPGTFFKTYEAAVETFLLEAL